MKLLKRLWCYFVGHKREYYERDRIFYARCKHCKVELDMRRGVNPFGW